MNAHRTAPVPRQLVRRFVASETNVDAAVDPNGRTAEFIASDGTVDRYSDVIEQDSWQLGHYQSNPIALWMHDYAAPVGNADVRVEGGRLLARVKFAAKGVSERIDELWRLVEAKVVRALSVGLTVNGPGDWEWIRDSREQATGVRFLKPELLELSLVTVPANPHALVLAKSLAADPRAYLHEETIMEPTEQPAGALRPLGGPVNLSVSVSKIVPALKRLFEKRLKLVRYLQFGSKMFEKRTQRFLIPAFDEFVDILSRVFFFLRQPKRDERIDYAVLEYLRHVHREAEVGVDVFRLLVFANHARLRYSVA